MEAQFRGGLKRLIPEAYQGRTYVHWTMTIDRRATGWLDSPRHQALRERLFHALARYHLVCPVYCLMPDHAHLLLIGLDDLADQRSALAWLRRQWNQSLRPYALQKQAYDTVLREKDREKDAFADVVSYILQNPERKELVTHWEDWKYLGSAFPGYPNLDPRKKHFWTNFWSAYQEQSRVHRSAYS